MPGMMDELMGALGGGSGGGLGAMLGGVLNDNGDDAKREKAAGLGLEAILGGLAGNAQRPDGAAALRSTLERHDGSVLDDAPNRLGASETIADGQKILGHVFGGNEAAVTQNIAAKSGLDVGSVAKMLPMLAPMVMGMLGKKAKGGGLDANGLAGMLKQESDGFDLGDIAGLLGGLGGLGGLAAGGKGGAGGLLGKVMGMLRR